MLRFPAIVALLISLCAFAAADLKTVSINPSTVVGGVSTTGTVTLTSAASGDVVVALSSQSSAITVPANVTVLSGHTAANFSIGTTLVSATLTRQVVAQLGLTKMAANLTLTPGLSAFSFSPNVISSGQNTTGKLTLLGQAPAGGATVALGSNNPNLVVPALVTIQAGATNASFTATSSVVSATVTATVSAVYGSLSKTAAVTLRVLVVQNLTFNPAQVMGGNSTTGTVTLSGPAPAGDAVVTLSAGTSIFTVPSSVTVPAGSQSADFQVDTVFDAVAITTQRPVYAHYNGTQKGNYLAVLPTVRTVDQQVNSIVYDPLNKMLYATTPSSAGPTYGNSVVPIDPVTGAIGTPVPVGLEPGQIVISTDQQFLYVNIQGSNLVRRVNILKQLAEASFSVGAGIVVNDIAPVPNEPLDVVVSTTDFSTTPPTIELRYYSNGVERVNIGTGTTCCFGATTSRVYSYDGSALKNNDFWRWTAAFGVGITMVDDTPGVIQGPGKTIRFIDGKVYFGSSSDKTYAMDGESRIVLGSYANSLGIPIVDVPSHTLWFSNFNGGSSFQISSFGLTTFAPVFTQTYACSPGFGGPNQIVWCDGHRVALQNGSKVYILDRIPGF